MGFLRFLRPFPLLLALSAPLGAQADQALVVTAGDTLTSIARAKGVTVEDLRRWNGLDSDSLQVGQRLRFEGRPEAAAATYEVSRGDTFTSIARSVGLPRRELLAFNPDLDPDHLFVGQVLRTGPMMRQVRYEVQPGETLTMIAARYETSVKDVLRSNHGLSPDRIRIGQTLTVLTELPESLSQSIGSPNAGRLTHAARLPRDRGYVIRDLDRAWGTQETIHSLHSAFVALRRKFPKSPKVEIHDISRRDGGFLDEHRSHQSGRDADVAYFHKRCKGNLCDFSKVKPTQLDAKRTWALMRPWLRAGMVESMFVDYSLQAPLYREARRSGATAEELSLWFQYPRGRKSAMGVVRHYKNHADHFHVRFACHDTDGECRTLRPLIMQAQQQYVSTVRR